MVRINTFKNIIEINILHQCFINIYLIVNILAKIRYSLLNLKFL